MDIQAKLQGGKSSGYSKQFLAEHEADILLHKAVKKVFDELGVQKLLRVKELQIEYAALLEQKKNAYAEYQQARQGMQEVLTAKANVDRLMGTEEQNAEKEKEHGQR